MSLRRDGLWMQPEPLLHLGLTNGDLTNPRGFGGLYAMGNSNSYMDTSGYGLFGGNKKPDEELNLNGNYSKGDKVAVPDAIAGAAPAVTALHNGAEMTEGIQFLGDGGGGAVQTVGPAVASVGTLTVDPATGAGYEEHSMDLAMQDAGVTDLDGNPTGPSPSGFVHSHGYAAPNLTPQDKGAAKDFAGTTGAGIAVAASDKKFGGGQRLDVNLTQQTAPGVFTVTHLQGDTASLKVKSVGPAP